MIQNSDYLITYNCGHGNTGNLVEAAQRRALKGLIHIENLAEKL